MKFARYTTKLFALGLSIVMMPAMAAEDTIYMEETLISGNQELPKVLYILPWREMTAEGLPIRTLNYRANDVMSPVYPAEYRRELAFRQQLKRQTNQSSNSN